MSIFCAAHRVPHANSTRSTAPPPPSSSSTWRCTIHPPTRPSPSCSTATAAGARSSSSTARQRRTPCSTWSNGSLVRSPPPAARACSSSPPSGPAGGPLDGDDERWLEASELADDVGVELLEWFVVSGDRPSASARAMVPARPPRRGAAMSAVRLSCAAARPG